MSDAVAATHGQSAAAEDGANTGDAGRLKALDLRVTLLVVLTFGLAALVPQFSGEKLSFLYKNALGLSASTVASLGIIIGIPTYLRPFMGALSDFLPVFGSHRRSYYIIAVIVFAGGYFGLASFHQYQLASVVCLVTTYAAGATLVFLITDAVMVAIGNRTSTIGRLQALQQGVQIPVAMAASFEMRGWVTQHWSYQHCFLASAITALLLVPVALLIDEQPQAATPLTHEEREAKRLVREEDRARTRRALSDAAKSPGLWAITVFVFYLIFTPGTGNATFYYEVDRLHFSKQFIGNLGFPASIGGLIGIVSYAFVSRWMSGRAFVYTAFFCDCVVYLLYMFFRDRQSAIIISFVGAVIGGFYTLSLLTIAARACPPGIEGVAYGLVLSAIALGGTLGEAFGAQIYDMFGPHHHHSVVFGWYALLWTGFVLTALAAFLFPFLPDWARSSKTFKQLRDEESDLAAASAAG